MACSFTFQLNLSSTHRAFTDRAKYVKKTQKSFENGDFFGYLNGRLFTSFHVTRSEPHFLRLNPRIF